MPETETMNSNGVGSASQWWRLRSVCIVHGVTKAGRWDRYTRASVRMGCYAELGWQVGPETDKGLGCRKNSAR